MPTTIAASFEEDDGTWCHVMTVPGDAFDIQHNNGAIQYQIDLDAGALISPVEPRAMSGTRCWQLVWFKAGQPNGLFIRRLMTFEVGDRALILRTVNSAERAA